MCLAARWHGGLSKAFAIVIFVVVILFSLLLITNNRGFKSIPDKVRALKVRFGSVQIKRLMTETEQFPNEVRIGDATSVVRRRRAGA